MGFVLPPYIFTPVTVSRAALYRRLLKPIRASTWVRNHFNAGDLYVVTMGKVALPGFQCGFWIMGFLHLSFCGWYGRTWDCMGWAVARFCLGLVHGFWKPEAFACLRWLEKGVCLGTPFRLAVWKERLIFWVLTLYADLGGYFSSCYSVVE